MNACRPEIRFPAERAAEDGGKDNFITALAAEATECCEESTKCCNWTSFHPSCLLSFARVSDAPGLPLLVFAGGRRRLKRDRIMQLGERDVKHLKLGMRR